MLRAFPGSPPDGSASRSADVRQQATGLVKGAHELIDVVATVVDRQRGACGGLHAEALHQRHGAVVAGADRHSVLVQDAAQVMGVGALHDE